MFLFLLHCKLPKFNEQQCNLRELANLGVTSCGETTVFTCRQFWSSDLKLTVKKLLIIYQDRRLIAELVIAYQR
jgi:hypothetical protein